MKKILYTLIFIGILGAFYWYVIKPRLQDTGPTNLPTAEELQRIEEIEKSSSQIAPNAVPGAGVRPVGSLPKPEPTPVSTSTASSTQEIGSTTATSSNNSSR